VEIKRRTRVVRIFPNEASCLRLIRALAAEQHETWQEDNRYINMTLLKEMKRERFRSLWRDTFRTSPPPAFTKDLIARFLCRHIQEQAFGGLDCQSASNFDVVDGP
jgi:Transposase, Mutator family